MICEETRVGFPFNNPNTDSDYHAPKWGWLVSPDTLRYDELFGNPLIAEADSQTITDDQLLDYARLAIAYFERELNIHILPRTIRYMDPIGSDGKKIPRNIPEDQELLSRFKTRKQEQLLYLRESGYPYKTIKQELRIKLRRRPVREILTAKFVDPYYNNTVVDLLPYHILKPGFTGAVIFRPNIPNRGGYGYYNIWQRYLFNPYYSKIQDIFKIDYTTGYENCQDVPDEFRNIIKKIAAVTLMNIYGDGKLAAIANRSISLNNVSESIGTTLSATSAAFGARIIQYQKEIKEWMAQNRTKFSQTVIGVL